ncbi:MAG TPA: hypothetical protein DCS93_26270, partial [Microscillaceae bacterium]|nr:hypothetical protein [Microscillaceae bacterium]
WANDTFLSKKNPKNQKNGRIWHFMKLKKKKKVNFAKFILAKPSLLSVIVCIFAFINSKMRD